MLQVAIVEDETEYMEHLRNCLERFGKEKKIGFHITCFKDGRDIVFQYQPKYDIIFMDIGMRFLNGLAAAREIRKTDENVAVVFVANTKKFAINGYAVNATDYVLKPFSYSEISRCTWNAITRQEIKKRKMAVLELKSGIIRVPVEDICYIECSDHTIFYHLLYETHEAYGTLRKNEQLFYPYHFMKINSGYLINPYHIKSVSGNNVLINGEILKISRGRKKFFMEGFVQYQMEIL